MRWALAGCWVARDCDIVDSSLSNSGEDGEFFLIDERPPDGRVCANEYGCNSLFLFSLFSVLLSLRLLLRFLFVSWIETMTVAGWGREREMAGRSAARGCALPCLALPCLIGACCLCLLFVGVVFAFFIPLFAFSELDGRRFYVVLCDARR